MTQRANVIDGVRVAREVKDDLKLRVARLAELAPRPGLGTILVGDDPASTAYVAGKHRDCAEVGIDSLRMELPGDATQQDILGAVQRTLLRAIRGCSRGGPPGRRPRRPGPNQLTEVPPAWP